MEDGWQPEAAERSGGRSQQEFKGECLNALPANVAQKAKGAETVARTVGKEGCPGNQGQGGGKDTFRLLNVVV